MSNLIRIDRFLNMPLNRLLWIGGFGQISSIKNLNGVCCFLADVDKVASSKQESHTAS
jgi:hypothetical protein